MTPTMKYWDDWVDAKDMEAMWNDSDVCAEWIAAGEKQGVKVHMSRNSDGKPYVTQTEMRAMAKIVIRRHFESKLDPLMICAIAEVESDRQPLAYRFEPKLGEASTGLMQTLQSTAEWLARDMGYTYYTSDFSPSMLYRPFVSVYFGGAFLKWLSTYEKKIQCEEFMVRAYNGGPKNATSKSTFVYWNKYLKAKQSLLDQSKVLFNSISALEEPKHELSSPPPQQQASNRNLLLPPPQQASNPNLLLPSSQQASNPNLLLPQPPLQATNPNISLPPPQQASDTNKGSMTPSGMKWVYWDEKTSPEDMDTLWRHEGVKREWLKSGEQVGKVRFARDSELRPYLTRTELKAVAEAVLSQHFKGGNLNQEMLCGMTEICSRRLLYGLESTKGLLNLSLSTALWLHNSLGYKAYSINVAEDLYRPFVSMYFAASYMSWLSTFEGRQRNDQFIVKAYLVGPQNVHTQIAGPYWLRYLEALTHYQQEKKRNYRLCNIQ